MPEHGSENGQGFPERWSGFCRFCRLPQHYPGDGLGTVAGDGAGDVYPPGVFSCLGQQTTRIFDDALTAAARVRAYSRKLPEVCPTIPRPQREWMRLRLMIERDLPALSWRTVRRGTAEWFGLAEHLAGLLVDERHCERLLDGEPFLRIKTLIVRRLRRGADVEGVYFGCGSLVGDSGSAAGHAGEQRGRARRPDELPPRPIHPAPPKKKNGAVPPIEATVPCRSFARKPPDWYTRPPVLILR